MWLDVRPSKTYPTSITLRRFLRLGCGDGVHESPTACTVCPFGLGPTTAWSTICAYERGFRECVLCTFTRLRSSMSPAS